VEEVEMQEDIGCGDKVWDHGGAQLTHSSDKHESPKKNEPVEDVAMEQDTCYINTDLLPMLLGSECGW
jgi:hypothetical protein